MVLSCKLSYNINIAFASCFEPHYESEAKCKVFVMKISFHSYANKTYFHMKSFVLILAFIVRFTATRKWPIERAVYENNLISSCKHFRKTELILCLCSHCYIAVSLPCCNFPLFSYIALL